VRKNINESLFHYAFSPAPGASPWCRSSSIADGQPSFRFASATAGSMRWFVVQVQGDGHHGEHQRVRSRYTSQTSTTYSTDTFCSRSACRPCSSMGFATMRSTCVGKQCCARCAVLATPDRHEQNRYHLSPVSPYLFGDRAQCLPP
jgi:hypothetical protein